MKVLYVEDSSTLRQTVALGLRREGYSVTTAEDGEEGLNEALLHDFDIIILDIMLPKQNGYTLLQKLRSEGCNAEILLLSARSGIEDRVAGLDMGADDYLTKPFAFEELLARLRALIRRKFDTKSSTVQLGKLRIDLHAKRIFHNDHEVSLRPREFDILGYLALNTGKIVSRTELIEHIYDHARDLKSNAVDSAICNIRKALTSVGCEAMIETVPRRGYLLESKT